MSKQPGIYFDIGRNARDLLYRGYTQQPPIHFHYRCFDWSFFLSCKINEIVPGLGTVFRFFMPYQGSNRVELQYLHDFAGITAGISVTAPPLLNFSGVIGSSFFSIGTDLSFDTATRTFSKCNAGFGFNSAILVASLTLNDKGDTLSASCYRSLNSLTNTAVAAELTHRFFSNKTTLTFGTQHELFPITLVKARVNNHGEVGALVQQQLLPTFFLTIAGELDVKAIAKSAKIGLSLAFRPQINKFYFKMMENNTVSQATQPS